MARLRRRTPLRGSVMQNTRLRARETSRFGFLARLGALVGSLGFIALLGAWLWHIGWPQRVVTRVEDAAIHFTQEMHFAVADIQVEGRAQTSKDALSSALGIAAGAPILAFDPAAAQARIAKLPWVSSALVERRLPDTIVVQLAERAPLARWQHDGRFAVIDAAGHELPDARAEDFTNLPLVVGSGAPGEARTFLGAVGDVPSVASKMTAAVRVGERRWDLYMQPRIVARMPESGLPRALRRLSQLIVDQNILERDIVAIDLRFPDRLIIESAAPTPNRSAGDSRL